MRVNKEKLNVAVVIINHKNELNSSEVKSLEQCMNVLGRYDKYMVVPSSLSVNKFENLIEEKIRLVRVKDDFLSTYRNFNRFKITTVR